MAKCTAHAQPLDSGQPAGPRLNSNEKGLSSPVPVIMAFEKSEVISKQSVMNEHGFRRSRSREWQHLCHHLVSPAFRPHF